MVLWRAEFKSPSRTPYQMNKTLLPIQDVARKLGLPEKYFEQVGPYGAKLRLELLADSTYKSRGKLILVTATTPTASGEGKTVTAIGLTQGLALLGKKVVITSREPSLGPIVTRSAIDRRAARRRANTHREYHGGPLHGRGALLTVVEV